MRRLSILVSSWLVALPALAAVPYENITPEATPYTTNGEFFLGVGFGGFTSSFGAASNLGVSWDIRGGINTLRYLGAELDYEGVSSSVHTFVASGVVLTGSYFAEQQITGNLKFGYPLPVRDQLLRPYLLAGVGYAHIGVDSSLNSVGFATRNGAAFPLGAGLSYVVVPGLVLDARYTYNLLTSSSGNTWNVGFNLGAVFGP